MSIGGSRRQSDLPVHRRDSGEGVVLRERRNWRIFSTFARQEYPECLEIIEEQLRACNGLAEYPIYVKGKSMGYQPTHQVPIKICRLAGCVRESGLCTYMDTVNPNYSSILSSCTACTVGYTCPCYTIEVLNFEFSHRILSALQMQNYWYIFTTAAVLHKYYCRVPTN